MVRASTHPTESEFPRAPATNYLSRPPRWKSIWARTLVRLSAQGRNRPRNRSRGQSSVWGSSNTPVWQRSCRRIDFQGTSLGCPNLCWFNPWRSSSKEVGRKNRHIDAKRATVASKPSCGRPVSDQVISPAMNIAARIPAPHKGWLRIGQTCQLTDGGGSSTIEPLASVCENVREYVEVLPIGGLSFRQYMTFRTARAMRVQEEFCSSSAQKFSTGAKNHLNSCALQLR